METPRNHLSHSQLSCVERSEQDYIRNYIWNNKKDDDSPFLKLGKRLAIALEHREVKEDDWIEAIKNKLPDYPCREYKIEAELNEIHLLGVLDGFQPKGLKVGEYKTGLKPNLKGWRDQQLFYSLIFWQSQKKLPKQIKLYWTKTYWNEDGQLLLTGTVKEYDIIIGLKDVIEFIPRVLRAWQKIKNLCYIERQKFGVLPFDKS